MKKRTVTLKPFFKSISRDFTSDTNPPFNQRITIDFSINEDHQLRLNCHLYSIYTQEEAEIKAKQQWTSFFNEDPAEIIFLNRKTGEKCYNEETAAETVLRINGPLHGLDLTTSTVDPNNYLEETDQFSFYPSFIDLSKVFPTIKQFFDMQHRPLTLKERRKVLKFIADVNLRDLKKSPLYNLTPIPLTEEQKQAVLTIYKEIDKQADLENTPEIPNNPEITPEIIQAVKELDAIVADLPYNPATEL